MHSETNVVNEHLNSASRLAKFAYKPNSSHPTDIHRPPSISSPSSRPMNSMTPPPAQSRDATHSSRFFSTPSTNGRVLVPNSSPISAERTLNSPQTPINQRSGVVIPNLSAPRSSWTQGLKSSNDPLSRPTGFVASTNVNNASGSRPGGRDLKGMGADDAFSDNERPRKRVNTGYSPTSAQQERLTPGSPESPEILRPGQKRKLTSNRPVALSSSMSSEEAPRELISPVAGSSKSRIVRRQPETSGGGDLTKFRIINCMEPRYLVDAAFYKANGNVAEATKLLSDASFDPQSVSVPSQSSPPASASSSTKDLGKVKSLEEEREAKRAQERQLAAKSAIYRTQKVHSTPPASVPASPSPSKSSIHASSPEKLRPIQRSKISRKRVIDSASEDEGALVIGSASDSEVEVESVDSFERQTLESFNTLSVGSLRELTGCTPVQADKIISLRPFGSVEDLKRRLNQGKKKAGPANISPRLFEDCVDIYRGYGNVDQILKGCEHIGRELKRVIDTWTAAPKDKGKTKEIHDLETGSVQLVSVVEASSARGFIKKPPSLLAPGVQLKDYQMTGISWLRLLHSKKYSCILADEMGLGKTVQVISFFAQLKEEGCFGPHLIVVPSSTLENWCREFERFAPSIKIQTYYGNKDDRPELRDRLLRSRPGKDVRKGGTWEVLITTYNLAVGDALDRKFFRKVPWDTCVFDEGHVLKNFQSQRYTSLMKIDSDWKLLLTGTPLQNNLQELVSVMNFILPDKFGDEDTQTNLRAIFKVKGDSKQLLAEDRVKRAKAMMTPFVLRRRKDQVLKDLPKKYERIEWCEMTPLQKSIYRDAKQRSRRVVEEAMVTSLPNDMGTVSIGANAPKKGRGNSKAKEKKYLENTSNVLMDLRKAASHPLLFRTQFSDSILTKLTGVLLKEPDFRKRGAVAQYVKEDMEVMTDSELQMFCGTYKSTQKFQLKDDVYLNSGKIQKMMTLLEQYRDEGRKVLIFSQFTQILDILQVVLKQRSIKFLLLTGSTAVDIRQGLVDEFTEDDSIPVFLLSTKAGGMGINLTAASVVILFDQDFNPHNDRQAADRAYRIGQRRDVDIVKLISRSTIEEDMYRLGQTKLALDEAVAGDAEEGDGDSKAEKVMRASLLETLRKQFDEEDKGQLELGSTEKKEGGGGGEAKGEKAPDTITLTDSDLTDIEDMS